MAASKSIVIIIDGGGTNTTVAAIDSSSVVDRTTLPTFKPIAGSLRTDELCRSLGSWLATAQTSAIEIKWILIGMAGIWSAVEKQQYLNSFAESWAEYISPDVPRASVVSDVELVHLAAHGSSPGIVLIAGTGSICIARTYDGRMLRCGGWGPRIDDAGSGFWMGREALRAVAQMLDGRGLYTTLIRPVAAYLHADADNHAAVSAALRNAAIDRCSKLAPAVLSFASENDVVALQIREEAADELARLVITLVNELTRADSANTDSLKLAFAGSLFKDIEFRESVSVRIVNVYENIVMKFVNDVVLEAASVLESR
ncbi:MAG: hypothetical protein HYX66_08285 [Ignavibacteria bacterium]|nr:hypothetical protein [Ignavibacteria bacterium]